MIWQFKSYFINFSNFIYWAITVFLYQILAFRRWSNLISIFLGLSHPHLVPCLLAVQCLDYFAIVIPYYPAGDLVELIGKQESSRVVRYMSHVAHTIEYLHRHDVAHIDVKLENVFVCESDCAHLGDLGMAMEVTHSSRAILAAHMGGTMEYWPPEKVNADEHTRIDPFKVNTLFLFFFFFSFFLIILGLSPTYLR